MWNASARTHRTDPRVCCERLWQDFAAAAAGSFWSLSINKALPDGSPPGPSPPDSPGITGVRAIFLKILCHSGESSEVSDSCLKTPKICLFRVGLGLPLNSWVFMGWLLCLVPFCVFYFLLTKEMCFMCYHEKIGNGVPGGASGK